MKKKMILIVSIASLVSLLLGLGIGLAISRAQRDKAQSLFQERLKEANKRLAMVQKRMADEKREAMTALEQQYQQTLNDLEQDLKATMAQTEKLKKEMRNLETSLAEEKEGRARAEGELKKSQEQLTELQTKTRAQLRDLEARLRQTEGELTRTRREYQEERDRHQQSVQTLQQRLETLQQQHQQQLQQAHQQLNALRSESQRLQSDLERTSGHLARCEQHNAALCLIAEELLDAYSKKGLGATLLGKEPITQIKKVELEQFVQKYQRAIEQQRMRKR